MSDTAIEVYSVGPDAVLKAMDDRGKYVWISLPPDTADVLSDALKTCAARRQAKAGRSHRI